MKALKDTLKKTMWESVEEPHRDLDCGLGAHPQTNQHRPHGDPEPVPRNMPAPHNEPVGCAEPVHDEPKPNEEPIANGSPHGKPAHPERTSNQDPNRPDRAPVLASTATIRCRARAAVACCLTKMSSQKSSTPLAPPIWLKRSQSKRPPRSS